MIIGNGDIASVLTDKNDFIFFASGVSNSRETRESEYQREKDLLMQQDKSKHLVYFSSLMAHKSDTRYFNHKKEMEKMVKDNFRHYAIIRIGNISWGKNPNTIINFLKNKMNKGEPIEIQDAYKNIIDKDGFIEIIDSIPNFSSEINIFGRKMSVQEIVDEIKSRKL